MQRLLNYLLINYIKSSILRSINIYYMFINFPPIHKRSALSYYTSLWRCIGSLRPVTTCPHLHGQFKFTESMYGTA